MEVDPEASSETSDTSDTDNSAVQQAPEGFDQAEGGGWRELGQRILAGAV